MTARIPLGRVGEPAEVAALICWLASEEMTLLDRRVLRHLRRAGDVLRRFVAGRHGPRPARRPAGRRRRFTCSTTTTRSRRCAATGEVVGDRAARLAAAARADPRAGDLVRGRHVRAQPRRAARGGEDRRARRLRARLRRRPARALHEGRVHAAHGRPGRLDPRAQRLELDGARARARRSCSARAATPVAVTIGNDVSSRDIEGANPLYIPQAKIFAGACAHRACARRAGRLGRAVPDPAADHRRRRRRALRRRDVDRHG